MLSFLFKKNKTNTTPQQLYGSVMAQSREPAFYANMGVPDSVMGRFDMLALHTYLLARRLKKQEDAIAEELSQEIFDLFALDIERALRQLGIGDTTVPKRKKRMLHSFYGQIEDFDSPLDQADQAQLVGKVETRYLSEVENPDGSALAGYLINADKHLVAFDYKEMLSGIISWPEAK